MIAKYVENLALRPMQWHQQEGVTFSQGNHNVLTCRLCSQAAITPFDQEEVVNSKQVNNHVQEAFESMHCLPDYTNSLDDANPSYQTMNDDTIGDVASSSSCRTAKRKQPPADNLDAP